ncbi:hypothetical protein ABZ490_25925 [Streptomyces sp. NPDC005811]|uniref:hypothetical protein n=1 Tax=Streptomyces sp. NPDC005811 TaxID=3154565 RepID=UPI0033F8141C
MNKTCSSISALAAQNSELEAAIRTAQKMLAAYGDPAGFDIDQYARGYGALSESLRILLRALDAEPAAEVVSPIGDTAPRCPAAHPEDRTPCGGPVAVTVLDRHNAGAKGCEHHGARLLASLDGARVYALPDAPDGAAIRVFKDAGSIRPFPWVAGPRTRDEQLSRDEVRKRGERP